MAKTTVYHCDNCGEKMPASNRYRLILSDGYNLQWANGPFIIDKDLCYKCKNHLEAAINDLQEKRVCYRCNRMVDREKMETVNGFQFYCDECMIMVKRETTS